MSYELDKLRLNPKEREKLLFIALKRVRYNGGVFNKLHQYRRNRFKEMTHKTYGDETLGYLLWHLRDNGYMDIRIFPDNFFKQFISRIAAHSIHTHIVVGCQDGWYFRMFLQYRIRPGYHIRIRPNP